MYKLVPHFAALCPPRTIPCNPVPFNLHSYPFVFLNSFLTMSRALDAPPEDDVQQTNDDQQFFEEIDKLTELSIAAADIKK